MGILERVQKSITGFAMLPVVCVVALAFGILGYFGANYFFSSPSTPTANPTVEENTSPASGKVTLPQSKWKTGHVHVEPVTVGDLQKMQIVTGKLSVNEDRTVHIFPMVNGRVREVNVLYGQDVEKDQTLAVIASRELAEAKLTLFQNRLETRIAKVNADRAALINTNTQQLIEAIRANKSFKELEEMFAGKIMGDYRKQLVQSYSNVQKSLLDLERLSSVSSAVAGKALIQAKASVDADKASFLAVLEQIQFDAEQNALLLQQTLEKAQAQEAINSAKLQILGYTENELKAIDPAKQGDQISYYLLKAPFAATVLEKDATIDETVSANTQMFRLADLTSLWLEADLFQKDLPFLQNMTSDKIRFRLSGASEFQDATLFYKGDIIDPKTRTTHLLANVHNADRRLKPGMFVEVELPGKLAKKVVQVPDTAILTQDGKQFVFVYLGGDEFEQRFVQTGIQSSGMVEIIRGLQAEDRVAVEGTFALKSELMRDLLEEAE